jgi:type VI secretion system protein ImpF
MPRADADLAVTPSVLDRLIDLEPGNASDPAQGRAQSVRQLKSSLRRDLEWLLNSRRNPDEVPETYQELHKSLYNYGLPDVTALSVNSARDRNRLLRLIESTIATFEPRISSVRVRSMDAGDGTLRILRFQIEGLLQMDPAPEQIFFDTLLQLNSGEYQVKGD